MKLSVNGQILADEIRIADTFGSRFLGLMGKKELKEGQGLLLKRCGSIHTCFMRFPIDVIYLSGGMDVLAVQTVKPWRMGKTGRKARHTLELPEGQKEQFQIGDHVSIQEG